MTKLFAALVALAICAPAQAATYTFGILQREGATFRVQGEFTGPITATFQLDIGPMTFPSLEMARETGLQAADYWFTANIHPVDQNGEWVPQYPSGIFGSSLHVDNWRCYFTNCFGTHHARFRSQIVLSDPGQSILLSTGGWINDMILGEGFRAHVIATVPDNLVPTPLPAALPLFASVLGTGAWIARRRLSRNTSRSTGIAAA